MTPETELRTAGPRRRPLLAGWRSTRGGWRAEHGFTIVEVMVAVLILVVGGLALVGLVDAANGATTSNKQREAGTNLARELIENVGTIPYDDVTPSGVLDALQAREGLDDSSAADGYTIDRRDVTFSVDLEVCNLDDPSDGLGSHVTGADGVPFCSGSGIGGSADGRPGDYRRVATTASWNADGETRTVRQSSFVMPPSGSDLPVVTTLTPDPPLADDTVTDEDATAVDFVATTSSVPAGVSWSKDGAEIGQATGADTTWNFTWPIGGLVDGDYVIGARGRTGGGSYGPVHPRTITLNRLPPAPPQNFVAGKSGSTVNAEWLANRERDIEGYHVYRQQAGGSVVQVNCGTVAAPVFLVKGTTCTDAQAPALPNGIDFVSSSQNSSETSSLTLSRPANVQAGDVLLMAVTLAGDASATGPGSGWSFISSVDSADDDDGGSGATRTYVYGRTLTASDTATSYTFNGSATRSMSGSITAWRDASTTALDGVSANSQDECPTGGCTTETAPSVTTTVANDEVVRIFGHRRASGTSAMNLSTPAGTTQRSVRNSASTVQKVVSGYQATPGATGTALSNCTILSGTCGEWVAHTVVLRSPPHVAVNYWVKAVDFDAGGNYREGDPSNSVDAYAFNRSPTEPSGLTGLAAADGSNVVNWTTLGTDPDSGDSVSFYRVYRGGFLVGRTASGTDTTWTDAKPGSGTHTYTLTAVDTRLAESPASLPVTVTQP